MNSPLYSRNSTNSINSNYRTASKIARKWTKNLALTELILSLFALCLGSTCTGINVESDRVVCIYGTGIWVGFVCTIRAIFALIALDPILKGHRGLLAFYFVICVISTVVSGTLVVISGHWIKQSGEYWRFDKSPTHFASYLLNILLLAVGLLHSNKNCKVNNTIVF